MNSFWSNKPVEISNDNIITILQNKEDILNKINKEIECNKFKVQYEILDGNKLHIDKIDNIVNFMNKNYVESSDESYSLVYTPDLFSFYCKNSIILEFYPLNNTKSIGYIIGKRSKVSLYNKILDTSEVNFLCIVPALRSLGLASYMINMLSREMILQYDIITSHYTVSTPIKIPYFGEKTFYHRFINFDNLYKVNFMSNLQLGLRNKFNFDKKLNYHVKYLNNVEPDSSLVDNLYSKYLAFCKVTYDIYEIVSLDEFKRSFMNKMFHHFIVYKKNKIMAYISLFRLDTMYKCIQTSIKAGYYYYMFFDGKLNITNCLEVVNKYIYDHSIFDILTFTDIFDINYNDINCIKGSSYLRYYFYNMKLPNISNKRNGMITI